jgi:diadenosine tetraphosphate (Ap4A) HIT family hydrolase
MKGCLFCCVEDEVKVVQNSLAFAMYDSFPVTPLHCLVIPKRHVEDFFQLTQDELLACNELLSVMRRNSLSQDTTIEGFNIGINVGEVAGQSIYHCHIHLIPRRRGDVENPKGGIRHLIPGKGSY